MKAEVGKQDGGRKTGNTSMSASGHAERKIPVARRWYASFWASISTKQTPTNNKMPTNWWGKQNAVPLKFDPKPPESAFFPVFCFYNFDKCRLEVVMITSYPV